MKLKGLYIVLFCALTQLLSAQHYLGLTIDAAAMCQLDNLPNTHMRVGGIGNVEVDYQYRQRQLILYTGLALGYYSVGQGVDDVYIAHNGNPELEPNVICNRNDQICAPSISIPMMLGAEWYRFYIMGGARGCIAIKPRTHTKALYDNHAEDDKFYNDFLDEILHNQAIHSKGRSALIPDIKARIEAGWHAGYSNNGIGARYRIALFVEYGLLNTQSKPVLTQFENEEFSLDYIYHAKDCPKNTKVNNLSVGLRFACLFEWKAIERMKNLKNIYY